MWRRGLLVVILLTSACGGDGAPVSLPSGVSPLPKAEGFPGEPAAPEGFADLFAITPYGDLVCDGTMPDLGQRRELRIFHHPSVTNVSDFTRGLARYYRRYGVSFYTRHAPIAIPLDWVIDLDEGRLAEHLGKTFPSIDLARELGEAEMRMVQREAFSFVLQGLLRFAATYGSQGVEVTNLVIVPSLTRDQLSSLTTGGTVAGVAISPVLVDELSRVPDSKDSIFWRDLPLSGPFTPMAFIGRDIAASDPLAPDLVTAHEIGHSLGLQHVEPLQNLMTPALMRGVNVTCKQSLDATQLERVGRTLGEREPLGAPPPAPGRGDPHAAMRAWLRGQGPLPLPLHAIE